MKTYNKSKIMKLAHQLKKREGYTMSQALILAWDRAKRNDFYVVYKEVKVNKDFKFDMNMLSSTLTNYYAK